MRSRDLERAVKAKTMKIADVIEAKRVALKWTQADLAKVMNKTTGLVSVTLHNYKHGTTSPSLKMLVAFSDALKIPLPKLVA